MVDNFTGIFGLMMVTPKTKYFLLSCCFCFALLVTLNQSNKGIIYHKMVDNLTGRFPFRGTVPKITTTSEPPMLNALPNISKSVFTEASSRGIYVFTAFKRLLERNQTGIFINGWEDRPVKTGNISVHCCFLLPTGGILSSLAATRVNFIYNPQLTATLYMCTAPQGINSHDQFAVSVTVVDKQPPARPGPLKQVAPMVSPKQVAAGSQARKPAPPVKQTAPPVKQTAPPVKQPAAPVKQTAPPVKQTAPQVKQTAPPVKQPAAPVKQPAPPVKQPAAPVKQPAPQVKQTAAEVAGNQTATVIEKVQTDQVKKPVPPHPQRKSMPPKQPVKKKPNPVSAKQNCSNKNVQNTCSTDTLEIKGEILKSSDLLKLIAQNNSVTSRKLLSINSSSNDKLSQSDTAVKQAVPTAESQPVIKSYSNIVCPTHPNSYVMPLEAIDVETAINIPDATDGAHLLEEKENIANKDPVIKDSKTPVKQVPKGNGSPGENNFSFAVCAKIIYGHADVELTIEWMEYYRRMGTSKVLAFTYNLTETAQKVIRHYEDIGFLETLPFEFPRPDNPKRTVGQKNAQAWNDEQVTIYHCHDRLINYKFVGVLDFDEFIIPHKDRNFKELFTQLLDSQKFASVFVFPHMVHVQEWNKTRKDSLKITSYLDHTKNLGYNLKAVYLPERVTEGKVFTHGLLAQKPDTRSVHVLGTIAQLSHYRMKCRPEWVKESNCFNKTLVRTTRIMEIVDEDLRTTIQKKKKLLLNID